MFDAKKLLDQFLGSQVPGTTGTVKDKASGAWQTAKDNPLATSAVLGVLLGTKTGRSLTGSALKLGGLAVVAGLGYQAYKNYQAGKEPSESANVPADTAMLPPPTESGFSLQQTDNDFALHLVRAMIAAANADGHIDASERANIMDKIRLSALDDEAGQFLERELAAPLGIAELVAGASTEEQRVEVYTVSRLTIDPDTRTERGYLDLLAGRLGLPDPLVEHIEATVMAASRSV